MKNFCNNYIEKQAILWAVEMVQEEIQNRYNWHFTTEDENGNKREKFPDEMDDEQKARLKALCEISKAIDKLL